ncbi:hypothetical protein [Candidatus Enterococcus clewellii]|uniref:Uncharacterized protein n=1 Tax=Candidatus Enterococcus clewellii TaxID=1834193 RepID=A0A242KDN7_9ENTE|nr:hypothetical protein [Enterococcus sp. 9E7_DIV0242]OTP19283.1 hypothetical protein A5888_001098 [Enterococcus sp. 9E7_DIV0242]
MSDQYTYISSSDPKHQLSESVAMQIIATLGSILPELHITYEAFDQIRFIDCGQNFSQVRCSYCGKNITEWWGDEMERCHSVNFENLYIVVPCCKRIMMLSQLHYSWPCSFARYAFRIENMERSIEPTILSEISGLAGTALVLIHQHI